MVSVRKQTKRPQPTILPTLVTRGQQRPPEKLGMTTEQMQRDRAAALSNGDLVGMLHAEAAAHPLLSADEEVELARRVQTGDAAARERMIAANIRLVGAIARYYVRSAATVRSHTPTVSAHRSDGLEIGDLMAEGLVGLIRAVDKFDPERGHRFSTCASWWIRQAIARGIVDRGYAITAPAYQRQRERLLQRLRHQYEATHGRWPTTAELAEMSGLTSEQVVDALELVSVKWSLETPLNWVACARISMGDELQLSEVLPDETSAAALEEAERAADASGPDSVTALMARLEPRHQREMEVLRRRHVNGETLEAIGRSLGVSRERVRQIEADAMIRVRRERARVRKERMQASEQASEQKAEGGRAWR